MLNIVHLSAISSDVEECRFNYCIHSDISSNVCQISIFNSIKDSLTIGWIEYRNIKKLFCFQHNLHLLLFCRRRLHFFCSLISIIERKNRSSATETLLLSHEAIEMTANDKCKWIPPHPQRDFPLTISNLLIFYCFIIDSTMLLLHYTTHSIRTL